MDLFLAARGEEGLKSTALAIADIASAKRVWVCPTDLRKEADIECLREKVAQEAGGLDVLVHSAGAYARGPLQDASALQFDELYHSNVRGPFLLTKAAFPLLKARKGQIVFINSSAGIRARGQAGQFSATQHALRALADALRDEINADGVRVLTMHLGRTATPRMQRLYEHDAKTYRPELLMQPEDVAAMAVAAFKQPRTAEVTEIHMRPLTASY
jgi:NADP-dependent 3-hydroxy acid dehydrogenase YdfG